MWSGRAWLASAGGGGYFLNPMPHIVPSSQLHPAPGCMYVAGSAAPPSLSVIIDHDLTWWPVTCGLRNLAGLGHTHRMMMHVGRCSLPHRLPGIQRSEPSQEGDIIRSWQDQGPYSSPLKILNMLSMHGRGGGGGQRKFFAQEWEVEKTIANFGSDQTDRASGGVERVGARCVPPCEWGTDMTHGDDTDETASAFLVLLNAGAGVGLGAGGGGGAAAAEGAKTSLPDKMYPKGLGYTALFWGMHCGSIWKTLCSMCGVAQCGNLTHVNKDVHQHQQRLKKLLQSVTTVLRDFCFML